VCMGDIALEKSIALFSATMLFHILGVTRGSDVMPLLCRGIYASPLGTLLMN
jgi:hypothetical protein